MGTQGGGPPNKWNLKVKTDGMDSDSVLDLLNTQADLGNTTVLATKCKDGRYIFFGNYGE